jgi:hypothetical protein
MICAAVIAASMGGPILQWRDRADACEGQTPRIESTCASACTMMLAVACVTPEARLGFHAPNWHGLPLSEPERAHWAKMMAAYLPPVLANWYLDGPAHNASFVWITGAEAVKHGAKAC